jgi:hypothetical protein
MGPIIKPIVKPSRKKNHLMYVRLPSAIQERLVVQASRLCCSASQLTRMAIIKFLEEEETGEKTG